MAILGAQLIASMILASVLSKFSSRFSFCQFIFAKRLVHYLPPSFNELKSASNLQQDQKSKTNKKNHKKIDNGNFSFPRNTEINIECVPVINEELIQLKYFTELQWIIDFFICSVVIYVFTELYFKFFLQIHPEFNLSIIWMFLGFGFSYKVLFALTAIYFQLKDGGEKITCIMNAFFSLIISMAILLADNTVLDFRLNNSFKNFSIGVDKFLIEKGFESSPTHNVLSLQIILVIFSAFLGGAFTFPSIRFSRMYKSSLKYATPLISIALHLNVILPGISLLSWCKTITNNQLHLQEKDADLLKAYSTIVTGLVRLLLCIPLFQGYLNISVDNAELIKRESGKILASEYQAKIGCVFSYFGVVSLQYLAPVFLLLHSGFGLRLLAILPIPQLTGKLIESILSYMTFCTLSTWFLTSMIALFYLTYMID